MSGTAPGRRARPRGRGGPGGPDDLLVVRDALLARARREAEAEAADAEERARATLDAAQAQADELVAAARTQGAADAAGALSGERARTLREARTRVLQAQRDAYDELRRRSVADVTALLDGLGPQVGSQLEREAAERLGVGAAVHAGAHGPVALAGQRRLSLEPEHLVDRALEDLGTELTGLWSP
ncbi:hypothetical protein [Nocardioides sp. T2.26MG-1]|uniref:hypothetical protein n=1 Tax=Nocardioides sp. T2.26MG-1 TaxID=3041166 RepID=UPI0024779157|nr:hypothetical protein [Nocardioides sp. T2.26MG-1]CAI9400311.1 V-type proton ATPase subunit E [Nocardioides sp. T2.26MG-1]